MFSLSWLLLAAIASYCEAYTVFSKNYFTTDFFFPFIPEFGWTFLTSPDGQYQASNIAYLTNIGIAYFSTGSYTNFGPPPGPFGYYSIFQAYVKLTDGPFYLPKGGRLTLETYISGAVGYSSNYGYLNNQTDLSPIWGNCGIWLVDVNNQVTTRLVFQYGGNLYLVHERLGYPGMGTGENGLPADFQGYSSWIHLPYTDGSLGIEYDRVGEGTVRIFNNGYQIYQFCRPGSYPSPLVGAKTIAEFASLPVASHDPVDSEWFQVYLGCGHDLDKLDPKTFGITREIGAEQLTTSNIYSIPSEFMRRYDGKLGYDATGYMTIGYVTIEIDKIFCHNLENN